MKKKRIGLNFATKLAIVAAIVLAIGGTTLSYALIDETNSVHIRASEIEDATLIIGTHLIYLGSMNDQIYEIAMESAEESNQYNRYYKSEIGGGIWYDITDAGALADITTNGIVVENKVIEALFMTHHTKSDGVTYDLRNGAAVGIFDINDPYDLSKMKELEPIKLQYDVLVQTEDPSDTMERDIQYIKEIYQFNRRTARTNEIDAQISALQNYYNILVRDEAEEAMSEKVMAIMDKLDAARRVEVLGPLGETQLQKMTQVLAREFVYLEGEITGTNSELSSDRDVVKNFVANSDLIGAAGEAMSNVQESYTNYSAKMLTEGTTVLSKAEYRFAMELISQAQGGNYSGCDEAVYKLLYLDRINNGVIQQETEEREFIAQELLTKIKDEYKASVGFGVGETYQTLASTVAASTRKNVLKNQLNETEVVRNELQFIMQAYIDRMTPEKGTEYISSCVDNIAEYSGVIKADAFETYAQSSVNSHLEWLTKTLKNLQSLMGGSALDDLREQKDALQTELMAALDDNRLDMAKKIETQIEAIDKELNETEAYLNAVMNSEFASESEKALAAAQLGDGSTLAALQDIRDNAIESIQNGDLDGIENALEGIGALANAQPKGAMGALKDIYGELSNQELMNGGSSKLNDLLNQVEELAVNQIGNVSDELTEDALANLIAAFVNENMNGDLEVDDDSSNSNIFDGQSGSGGNSSGGVGTGNGSDTSGGAGTGNGSGSDTSGENGSASGSESDNKTSANSSKLNAVIKSLDEEQMSTALAGLSIYAEQTNADAAEETLKIYGKNAFKDGNDYVYNRLEHEFSEFIPTDKLAKIIGYRYIFNDSQKIVTLQRGSQYYQFEAFSSSVKKGKDYEEMSMAAGFQGVIYIPSDAAQGYFGVTSCRLYNTSYGVILTKEMNDLALEFSDYLLEAGEGL